jgi:hypothetical protein
MSLATDRSMLPICYMGSIICFVNILAIYATHPYKETDNIYKTTRNHVQDLKQDEKLVKNFLNVLLHHFIAKQRKIMFIRRIFKIYY